MTLLPFPDRPALDDVHEGYIFDGTKWICIPTDGGGGGALPNIPPYTLFGNNMATTGQPVALNGAEATALLTTFDATDQGVVPAPGAADPGTNVLLSSGAWGNAAAVIGTFPAAQPGLVPAPGTASTNACLLAAGVWRPPLARFVAVYNADYVATPNDDILLVDTNVPITITLPASNGAVTTQQFRVVIRSVNNPITFQTPAGDTFNFFLHDRASLNYGAYVTTFTIQPPSSTVLLFINQGGGGGWWVVNQGLPKQITSTVPNLMLPGVVPNPPAGTIANAALQADMTWQVPGTNATAVTTDYTIPPTMDFVTTSPTPTSSNITWTLPAASTVPIGKVIRLNVYNLEPGITFTIQHTSGNFWFMGTNLEWGSDSRFTFTGPLSVQLYAIARSYGWFLVNEGQAVSVGSAAGPRRLIGGVPGPPAGTPATAVLHADMTWY